ncbi:hypothetical protein CANCADRAFT_11339, partial [Tortispora caseinolytica NRRL Y-17796]
HPNQMAQVFAGNMKTVLRYEDSSILDQALAVLPLERLYNFADADPENHQDALIKELLNWFKNDFFTWVDIPNCSVCGSSTQPSTESPLPTADEQKFGAGRVEVYKCISNSCGAMERFPRYNNPAILLQTKRGRCGEWANAFGLLCRALGSRVRFVWNSEDHVWIEVYSPHQKRWIHTDPCENAWDNALLYSKGWGKKMAYCIAFEATGPIDVSRRYIRDIEDQLPRYLISEADLKSLLAYLRLKYRTLPIDQLLRLYYEDVQELAELNSYKANAESLPDITSLRLNPRSSGSAEWIKSRGENGR